MARNTRTRRSTRLSNHKSPEQEPEPEAEQKPEPAPAPELEQLSARSSLTPVRDDEPQTAADTVHTNTAEDTCPACQADRNPKPQDSDKESWVRCDACRTWYHWRCAGNGGDLETIDKWYCPPCTEQNPARVVTFKPPARKSSRKKTQLDYANLNSGVDSDPNRWVRVLKTKPISEDNFKRMQGDQVGLEWLENDEEAMREPIVIEAPEGLGMKMPGPDFTVNDVADIVGRDVAVEVIDVASQSTSPGWTLGRWAEYYHKDPRSRDKIRNVISLEISDTPLADRVLPPRLVRELDWVERYWPSTRRGKGHAYPKVQLYCLMSVADAWTDWHVDFAGSSVYYHILRGSKVFYFIRPTPTNLAAYEKWSGTELQTTTWLGDMVDEVIKVTLQEGNTMFIPTGWIHAVHTPVDSLVFGGNFLHSYNVATQIRVQEIEKSTHVPKKFRFPLFTKLCWYVADKWLRDLKTKEVFSPRVLESMDALCKYLMSEVRTMEKGSDHGKRDSREQVPAERVKDPAALARELRWRVRLAAGCSSDDEDVGNDWRKKRANGVEPVANGTKRKRSSSEEEAESQPSVFLNFQPKPWDMVHTLQREDDSRDVDALPPEDGAESLQAWAKMVDEMVDEPVGTEDDRKGGARVKRERHLTMKVRKTEGGLERQRIERTVEKWEWPSWTNHLGTKGDNRNESANQDGDGEEGHKVEEGPTEMAVDG